jgi:hypothetical protein
MVAGALYKSKVGNWGEMSNRAETYVKDWKICFQAPDRYEEICTN